MPDAVALLRSRARYTGGPADREQLGELGGAVLTGGQQVHQVRLLPHRELGFTTPQVPLSFRDLHALAGAEPDQVGLELSNHRQHVE